jgi:hypothetical protein
MRHTYGAFDYARALPNVEIALRAVKSFRDEIIAFGKAVAIIGEDPKGIAQE